MVLGCTDDAEDGGYNFVRCRSLLQDCDQFCHHVEAQMGCSEVRGGGQTQLGAYKVIQSCFNYCRGENVLRPGV